MPSENEHVLSDSSSDSSEAKSTNQSNSGGSEHSEGRNTLVLENSNEVSCESGRLKSLDDNLAQLNIVVAKLREKDADVQKITQSLLVNFWKQNGSGDCPDNLGTQIPSYCLLG